MTLSIGIGIRNGLYKSVPSAYLKSDSGCNTEAGFLLAIKRQRGTGAGFVDKECLVSIFLKGYIFKSR